MTSEEHTARTVSVSVAIPAYGNTDYLQQAIQSALEQSPQPLEILVVDDGSPQPLAPVVEAFGSPLLRCVSKEHSGTPATRNRCISEAKGDYILWLDSDDLLLPGTLAAYLELLERAPQADVVYGDLLITDSRLKPVRLLQHSDWEGRNRQLISLLVQGNPIPNPGSLVRRELYDRCGSYDESFSRSEDYEFWTRAAGTAVFKHVKHTTLLWRWHERDLASGVNHAETRFNARIVKLVTERYPLEELFPEMPWEDASRFESEAAAWVALADRLLQLDDRAGAVAFLERSLAALEDPGVRELLSKLNGKSTRSVQRTTPNTSGNRFRVLLAAQSFPPYSLAGTELYTYNLARELLVRGHRVITAYPVHDPRRPNGEMTRGNHDGVQVLQINQNPAPDLVRRFRNPAMGAAFRRIIEDFRPDVAHFQHLLMTTTDSAEAAHCAGIPTLLTLHDTWMLCEQSHFILPDGSYCRGGPETVDKCTQCAFNRYGVDPDSPTAAGLRQALAFRRQEMRRALDWIDILLTPTRFLKETFIRHGLAHPNFKVAPLGLPPLTPLPHHPGDGRVRLAFLGNIFPTKGLDILVDALNRLPAGGLQLNVHGRIADIEYFQTCLNGMREKAAVRYQGAYTPRDLPAIFAGNEATVISSRAENFPTVARESHQAGLPVIAPRVGGIPEIVTDGINGLLYRLGDPQDLARCLKRLLDEPGLLPYLAAGIKPPLTIAADADRLEELYSTLTTKRRPVAIAACR